jgi:NAD(P)-dependent dehydrogenase (short-subunit alcohol dehydrogenase family)
VSKQKPLIVITGASQGIGAAIAKAFAAELPGCCLALVARNERNLCGVAKKCLQKGASSAEVFPCDVTDEAQVKILARKVRTDFGVPDVLINNAGVFRGAPLLEMSVDDFDAIIRVNLRSVFLVSKAFVPGMVARGSGHVFNMSSIAGLGAYPNGAGYCAAKFAVTGLSKVMRMELMKTGVRVTCVHPGATVSPSWRGTKVPKNRMMPPEDVARAFVDMYRMSPRTVVEDIVLRPQWGDL